MQSERKFFIAKSLLYFFLAPSIIVVRRNHLLFITQTSSVAKNTQNKDMVQSWVWHKGQIKKQKAGWVSKKEIHQSLKKHKRKHEQIVAKMELKAGCTQ